MNSPERASEFTPHPSASGLAANRTADICVIRNPGSGKQGGDVTIEAMKRHFAEHPGRFELRIVASGGDIAGAARRAVADGFPIVVAAGGDGTIRAVAAAVAGSSAHLGVLPLGTFNYFARSIGLPDDLGAAVRVLIDGAPTPWDIGYVNGHAFLNNASLGLYPTILQNRENIYNRWGRSRIAAHGSVLLTLAGFRAPLALKVTVDGAVRRVRTPLVFIAKNPAQLEEIGVDGAEGIREGRFALFIAPDCSRWQLLRYAIRLALRTMAPGRDFELVHGRDILVETARSRMTVACDGEREKMASPFRFELRRDALNVILPAANA